MYHVMNDHTFAGAGRPASHVGLDQTFAAAAGSVCGREHQRTGRNNQDAVCWCGGPNALIAMVADGCSGGSHNEVGARLGVRLVTAAIRRRLSRLPEEAAESLLAAVRLEDLARFGELLREMGGPAPATVRDDDVAAALRDGEVTVTGPAGPDRLLVSVAHGGRTIPAVFVTANTAARFRAMPIRTGWGECR